MRFLQEAPQGQIKNDLNLNLLYHKLFLIEDQLIHISKVTLQNYYIQNYQGQLSRRKLN